MSSNTSNSSVVNIDALDGLRGLAIISVIIHHCFYMPDQVPYAQELNGLLQSGRLGVCVFFVLSGFLMGLVVFRSSMIFPVSTYIRRRFARIYPPFLLSVIFGACVALIRNENPLEVTQSSIMYLTTLVNFKKPPVEINEVLWSLLIEIHFYCILPIIYLIFRRFTKHAIQYTCLIFAVVSPLMRVLHFVYDSDYLYSWNTFKTVFPMRMDSFFLGLLFSSIYINSNHKLRYLISPSKMFIIGISGLVITYLLYAFTFIIPWIYNMNREGLFLELAYGFTTLSTFFILWVVFDKNIFANRLFTNRLLVFCGLISYEWYLFHFPIIYLCKYLLPAGQIYGYVLKIFIPLIGSFILSSFIYHKFSKPIQEFIRADKA